MSSDPASGYPAPSLDAGAGRRQRFGIALTLVLVLIATAISAFATRDTWSVAMHRPDRPFVEISAATADLVWDIELPVGPHRNEFQTSCLICHSARLPFGQPPFRREKWAEIVHKMVAVYGAPLTTEDEGKVVEYLIAVSPSAS